jgi:threonine dehydratase
VIDRVLMNSPQFEAPSLGEPLGLTALLKLEIFNPIRSFKGRGADLFASSTPAGQELVCASSGNFGQGLAWACAKRGLTLSVYTAAHANPLKIERIKRFGAAVVAVGNDFDEAKLAAVAYAEHVGAHFIEDGRDIAVTEGAGTIGMELATLGSLDAVVLPVGNGALINGVGTWLKAHAPDVRIVGVCATGAPSMELSWRAGSVHNTDQATTIADGIAIRLPVSEAISDMEGCVDDVILVDDDAIVTAMRLLLGEVGVAAEPSGAVGLAGLVALAPQLQGMRVATVVTGANLTPAQRAEYFC